MPPLRGSPEASNGTTQTVVHFFLPRFTCDKYSRGNFRCGLSSSGMYFNSGTWARLLRLPDAEGGRAEWNKFLKSIENKSYEVLERPTYVRVTLEADETTRAALHLWPQEDPLALRRFAKGRQWLN